MDLPEAKLAIVHCAGQYDEGAIEGFWQEIIEKEVRRTCLQRYHKITLFGAIFKVKTDISLKYR